MHEGWLLIESEELWPHDAVDDIEPDRINSEADDGNRAKVGAGEKSIAPQPNTSRVALEQLRTIIQETLAGVVAPGHAADLGLLAVTDFAILHGLLATADSSPTRDGCQVSPSWARSARCSLLDLNKCSTHASSIPTPKLRGNNRCSTTSHSGRTSAAVASCSCLRQSRSLEPLQQVLVQVHAERVESEASARRCSPPRQATQPQPRRIVNGGSNHASRR